MLRHRIAILACSLLGAALAHAEIVDEVLATVDNEAILRSDVMAELGPYVNSASGKLTEDEVQAQAKKILDQAIDNKILLRQAQLAGVSVPDDRVEEQLDKFKKDYPSNEDFMKELDSAGETVSDLRTRLRKQLMAISMAMGKHQALEKEVVVSEADVTQYYEDHKQQFEHSERVRCSQIFLAAKTDAERAAARARLGALKDELASGADFAQLAIAHSEAPGAKEGGIIGWIQHSDLEKSLEDAAFALPEGGVSDVVESPGGVHLLKVLKKDSAGVKTLDEARTDIEPILRKQEAGEKYQKWMAELRKRSRVQVFI